MKWNGREKRIKEKNEPQNILENQCGFWRTVEEGWKQIRLWEIYRNVNRSGRTLWRSVR